jgi:preprotein translocase subunit SecD
MEPLTAAAIAIATVIATKALETTGEKVGEALWDKTGQFLVTLKKHSPHTVVAIEKAPSQPLDYGKAVLEVESAAKANPEVNQAVQELVIAAKADPKVASKVQEFETNINSQPATVINNHTKLAEEIKNFFQGNNFYNNTF